MNNAANRSKVVALDFDGCIADGGPVKVEYANTFFAQELMEKLGRGLTLEETAEERFPLGPQKYRQMMNVVGTALIMRYELVPGCKEVLDKLAAAGHPRIVITSRVDVELYVTDLYAEAHELPLSGIFNTNRDSKRSLIERLKPAAFLDDTLSKLEQLTGTGTVLYFLKQPWNEHEWQKASELEEQGLIVPVDGWQQFYSHVTGADLAAARVINHA